MPAIPTFGPVYRRAFGRSVRCEDGRLLRHDPQADDPYLETDIGECEGCEDCVTLHDLRIDEEIKALGPYYEEED